MVYVSAWLGAAIGLCNLLHFPLFLSGHCEVFHETDQPTEKTISMVEEIKSLFSEVAFRSPSTHMLLKGNYFDWNFEILLEICIFSWISWNEFSILWVLGGGGFIVIKLRNVVGLWCEKKWVKWDWFDSASDSEAKLDFDFPEGSWELFS